MTIASRPPASRTRVQASILALAKASAGSAHVTNEAAAAAHALGDDDLAAMPRQQADRRLVDLRRQHLLRAAAQQRHALPARALGRESLRRIDGGSAGDAARQHRRKSGEPARHPPCQRVGRAFRRSERNGSSAAAAGRSPAARAASGPPAGDDMWPRYGRAPGRRGACNGRPRDRWSCRRGRRGSGRCA